MYALLLGMVIVVFGSCDRPDPELMNVLTTEYPSLYEAVFLRDGEAVLDFTASVDSMVRVQAWRALISTPYEDTDELINKVKVANTPEAWASLWFKELSEEDIAGLNNLWDENPNLRTGLASILGEKGNETSFELLITSTPSSEKEKFEIALAIGKLSGRIELKKAQEQKIIERVLSEKNADIAMAYLYGIYRFRKDLDPENETKLKDGWANYYPDGPGADQYIARVLMKNNLDEVLYHFDLGEYEFMNVQLAIELIQGIARAEETKHSVVILNSFLSHRNPLVRIQALRAIKGKEGLSDRLFVSIMNNSGLNVEEEPLVRLEALNVIPNPADYKDEIYQIAGDNPYLQSIKYDILTNVLSSEEFLNMLQNDLRSEEQLIRFYAIQELASWWANVDDDFKTVEHTGTVRALVERFMKTADRSMIYEMGTLLMDEELLGEDSYPLFEDMLSRFSLPFDVEVYQSVTRILKSRFEEQALSLIDSLAMEGNAALNRTLLDQGWDILQGDYYPTEFRTPDWEKLASLGRYPVLVLQTSKGDIKMWLDITVAPAMISGMQSLIEKGEYNGVPFHRVVPNFVLQGGDVETKNGYGGPDYVVPTEASAKQYRRGVVGIASAGRDTEGSQYFIMHSWMPHLNGRYTIIGEVFEGMDVADRIVQGDLVEYMYWEE